MFRHSLVVLKSILVDKEWRTLYKIRQLKFLESRHLILYIYIYIYIYIYA